MTAEEAYEIALNDPIRRITDKKIIEEAILTDPDYIVRYSEDIIKGRWEQGENVIVNLNGKKEVVSHLISAGGQYSGKTVRYNRRLIDNSIFYSFLYYKRVICKNQYEVSDQDSYLDANTLIGKEIIKDIEICLGSLDLVSDYAIINGEHTPNPLFVRSGVTMKESTYLIFQKNIIENFNELYNSAFYSRWTLRSNYIDNLFMGVGAYYRDLNSEHLLNRKRCHEAIKCYYYAKDQIKGRWEEGEPVIRGMEVAWKMYQDKIVNNLPPVDVNKQKMQIELEALKAKVRELECKLCEVV